MGRFDTTKSMINANVKTNGKQEITGQVMNNVLTQMVEDTDSQLTELESKSIESMGVDLTGALLKFRGWFEAIRELSCYFNKKHKYGVAYIGVTNNKFTLQIWNQTTNSSAGTLQQDISNAQGLTRIIGNITEGKIGLLIDIDSMPSESVSTTTIDYQPKLLKTEIDFYEKGNSFMSFVENPINRIYCSTNQDYSIGKDDEMLVAKNSIDFSNTASGSVDVRFYMNRNFINQHKGKSLHLALECVSSNSHYVSIYCGGTRLAEYSLPMGYSFAEQEVVIPSEKSEADDVFFLVQVPLRIGAVYCSTKPMEKGFDDELAYASFDILAENRNNNETGNVYTIFNGIKAANDNLSADNAKTTFGFIQDVKADIVVKAFEIGTNGAENAVMELMVGIIDQRNMFIKRKGYEYKVSSVTTNRRDKILVPVDDAAIVYKGEVVFIDTRGYKWKYSTSSNVVSDSFAYPLYILLDDGTSIQKANGYNLSAFKLIVADYKETPFYNKDSGKEIETKVAELSQQVQSQNQLKDIVTGEMYKIIVANGNLSVKLLQYKKILVIGNSFTNHGPSEGLWYQSRGMASSRESLEYKTLLLNGLGDGASVQDVRGFPFETNYSPNFDFSSLGLPNESFDLVICQIGENGSYKDDMKESWMALYRYLKTKYQTEILQIIGWRSEQKYTAISEACLQENVALLDCNNETYTGNFRSGDYITTTSLNDFDIIVPAVRTHPSDVGMLLIANKILSFIGKPQLDLFRKINLVQTDGGKISTNYIMGVIDGVVSIKCEPNEGKTINAISVVTASGSTISATYKENQFGKYYIFFMPNEAVQVTATFA